MVKGRWLLKRHAFSLVEMMITAATVGLVLSLLAGIVTHVSRFLRVTEAKSTIQVESRIAMDSMVRLLRTANVSDVTIDTPPGQPPYSRLVIRRAPPKGDITFRQDGPRLLREDKNGAQVLSPNLKVLMFTYPNGTDHSRIGVSVSLEKRHGKNDRAETSALNDFVHIMNP